MASISKFSTALLSVPNEITVAAANFNLNFSLMKVEAPPEFRGLRDALSHARRREAEEGVQHITARCLGALFECIIPPIPHLTAAYGKRVSELSGQMKTAGQSAGMFADRVGADGTSIWAAATSGQHAIAMHLLSCMLSRIWKPAEATSLWVELVERRKQEILKAYNDSTSTGISSIMAAQQPFNREQLAAWDASTRSWLQTADVTKQFEQTQLMLIINNVRMPVNARKDPYESVIAAWTSGMNTMERLICGTPQRVQDGAILLAITSWHLYPNMQVLSDHTKDINSGDELMARSMLTISTFGTNTDRDGVFWSLPLSRMRYYSPPVISERSLASDTSRISMEEFQIVFLGSFVAQWKDVCSNEMRCCNFIVRLRETLSRHSSKTPAWFQLIADAASRVINSSGHLQAQYHKLLKLGSRRCEAFIHEPSFKPPAFFGLEYFSVLVRTLGNNEECIQLLRRAAASRAVIANEIIIRYKNRHHQSETGYQYASVLPYERSSYKRSASKLETPSTGHRRFSIGRCVEREVSCFGGLCGCSNPGLDDCICMKNNAGCTSLCHPDWDVCTSGAAPLPFECRKERCSETEQCAGCSNRVRLRSMEEEGEEAFLLQPHFLDDFDEYQFRLRKPDEAAMPWYGLWLGHSGTAAVFCVKTTPSYNSYNQSASDFPSATIEEIEAVLLSPSFDPSELDLDTCCGHWTGLGVEQTMCSLNALLFASRIYASMAGSTVSIEVMNSHFYNSSWAASSAIEYSPHPAQVETSIQWNRETDFRDRIATNEDGTPERTSFGPQMQPIERSVGDFADEQSGSTFLIRGENGNQATVSPIDRGRLEVKVEAEGTNELLRRSFACIAWFDSGEFDIPVTLLDGTMALANGDSIYVASALLADPSVTIYDAPIRRVFGNLGRSEMSLLVPPADPRLAEPDLRSWKHVNHCKFDGRFQNCFNSTSLHLTFTDSEDTMYLGNRGLRDRQIVFVEALVSIDDRGRNIGDLDILSMFNKPTFSVQKKCGHTSEQKATYPHGRHLTAVDCWEEFLDPPQTTAIFRAEGNWQARLGAAAAAVQMGKRVLVLPEKACLQCLRASAAAASEMIIA